MNSPPSPYIGPRSFLESEKLYGRDRELADLMDLLIAERIVLLYSPSGAGKSSLINAGLIPAMKKRGFTVPRTIRVNRMIEGSTGNRYLNSILASLQIKDLTPDPKGELLIFDQFEEILTTDPVNLAAKREFFEQLGEALRSRGRWVLFAMREDFLAALDPYLRYLPTRLTNTFRLDMLSYEASLEAIREPAKKAGVPFADGAAEQIADDLRKVNVPQPDRTVREELGQFVEPVQLQVVCLRRWEDLPEGSTVIPKSTQPQIGSTALADYYASKVGSAWRETGATERVIRDWFDDHLITKLRTRGQVQKGPEESGGLDNRAIKILEEAHLVRSDQRLGAVWLELAHDRLIEPVRISNKWWRRQNLSLLQREAELWHDLGRPTDRLLGADSLAAAEKWALANKPNSTEEEFLIASRVAEEQRLRDIRLAQELKEALTRAEEQKTVAEAQKALAETARAEAEDQKAVAVREKGLAIAAQSAAEALRLKATKAARTFKWGSAVLALLLAVSVWQYWSGKIKDELLDEVSSELEFVSSEAADADAARIKAEYDFRRPALALAFLARRLDREANSQPARDLAARYLVAGLKVPSHQLPQQSPITGIVFSEDGGRFMTLGEGSSRVWDKTGKQIWETAKGSFSGAPTAGALNYDGKLALLTYARSPNNLSAHVFENGKELRRTQNGQFLTPAGLGEFAGVARPRQVFSTRLGRLQLWDLDAAQPPDGPQPESILFTAFNPGRTAFLLLQDHAALLWNLSERKPILPVTTGSGSFTPIPPLACLGGQMLTRAAVSSDASRAAFIAKTGGKNHVYVWKTASSSRTELSQTREPCSVGFTPDGRKVVVSGRNWLQIWDADTYRPEPIRPISIKEPGAQLVFVSGQRVYAETGARAVLLLDVPTGKELARAYTQKELHRWAVSDDGNLLVTAQGDTGAEIQIWDLSSARGVSEGLDPADLAEAAGGIRLEAGSSEPVFLDLAERQELVSKARSASPR